jgi:membrane protein DedA with SNARE-associated domain
MSIVDKILNLPFPILNHWGYWIILFAALLEATPIFGLLIPGMAIVIIGGFLAKLGILELGDVIFVSALGAILGDLIGYLLGKKYGYSFITKYGKYFFFKKEHFEKTKKLMNHHTGKALIIGRFNSLTRAFAPFVAGSTNVSFLKFLIYNLIGGISWAVIFVMVGFIFGESYELASQYIGKFIFIAIILSILFIYLYKFVNKRKHIFSKYHLYALILNIFSLYLFSKMAEDVIDKEFITRADVWVNAKMILIQNLTLNKIITENNTIFSYKSKLLIVLLII